MSSQFEDRAERRFDRRAQYHHRRFNRRGDKLWFGFVVIGIGILLMLKKLGIFYFAWHTFWPFLLIGLGLMLGIKHRFHHHAWWILILIGTAHIVPEFEVMNGVYSSSLMVPLALIIGGVVIAIRSQKKNRYMDTPMQVVTNTEGTMNIDVTFGGRKEIVTSKDFKGGTVSTFCGGVELNLLQADSAVQPMVLNMRVSFSGVELIVPSHWEIQNEIEPSFGNVEDHRSIHTNTPAGEEKKVLILKGTCSFGNIEIKSY